MDKKRFSDRPETNVFHLLSNWFFLLIFEVLLLVLTWATKIYNFFLGILRFMLHDEGDLFWLFPGSGLERCDPFRDIQS